MSGIITIRGASNSQIAEVDKNALRTRRQNEWDYALANGNAYSWSNAAYDYTAADTILGLENNSGSMDLKIKKIFITAEGLSQFVVHTSSGVTMTGTAVTGVNMNRNSGNVADATAIGDETGNGQAATTYSGRLLSGRFADNGIVEIDLDGAIVLPNDHNIGIDLDTHAGTDTATITIWGYFVAR